MMAGTGNMRKFFLIVSIVLLGSPLVAQEVLLPLCRPAQLPAKAEKPVVLPFFDDFSKPALSNTLWTLGGTFVNQGYAPLPPTVGMATLDAFDAQGRLYPTEQGQLAPGDTLLSLPIRLDSLFKPYSRSLTPADSLYLSFFYIPGGGYGNMWERVGDVPESQDSLILEFYDPQDDSWNRVWTMQGCSADTLFAHTGSYWQFVDIPILESKYFRPDFRFRFRNLCSLDNINKNGILSNADQWNIDYVSLNSNRHSNDTAARDVAFVNPAPSLLKGYQSMPARQFTPSELRDSLPLTIVNRYTEELATNYGYTIVDNQGQTIHTYDGGFENTPVYWRDNTYQTAPAHARPPLNCSLPVNPADAPVVFTVVHGLREGVSGDNHTQNDTIVFTQTFDNYYAYDDGTPENGYGITSTTPAVRLACRFKLNTDDTLTALYLYFNQTFANQNSNIRFYITVWDDNDGHPGNVIYRDSERRRPAFNGFNRYVRYLLEEPVLCTGTVYIGFEQTSSDYINLGFDRNNNASQHIFYLTGTEWQTSILSGALMLRPAFGHRATLDVKPTFGSEAKVYALGQRIVVETDTPQPVAIYNLKGQCLYRTAAASAPTRCSSQPLPAGLYLVRVGLTSTHKIIVQ